MQPSANLTPQLWMTDPATQAVVAALTADGAQVRFVGGCVRDAILGRAIKDIDIATPDPPERVIALLERAQLKAVPTGIAHGTVTAVAKGRPFEITTLRKDVEHFGRHARVEFTDDWVEDAARRDLTFNAMSLSPEGALYDPFGGRADLAKGYVRFVGDAMQRIEEDRLRLLRYFRFFAHYGREPWDEAALAACRAMAPKLPELSGERLQAETLKLLAADNPVPVLEKMAACDITRHFLPEAKSVGRVAALIALPVASDALLRLAAWIEGDEAARRQVAGRLKLSNVDRDRLAWTGKPVDLDPKLDDKALRQRLYRLGAERYRDLARLGWCDRPAADWRHLFDIAQTKLPEFPIKGRDAMDLGLPAGPRIGKLVEALENWWIEGDFRADRKACLAELKERIQRGD